MHQLVTPPTDPEKYFYIDRLQSFQVKKSVTQARLVWTILYPKQKQPQGGENEKNKELLNQSLWSGKYASTTGGEPLNPIQPERGNRGAACPPLLNATPAP
jgi:hypothetical protein